MLWGLLRATSLGFRLRVSSSGSSVSSRLCGVASKLWLTLWLPLKSLHDLWRSALVAVLCRSYASYGCFVWCHYY